MKRLASFFAAILFCGILAAEELPDSIFVGGQMQHVQGIALDKAKGLMYMSFTSRFVKTDLQGNIIASIDRIQGHLGAMTFNPEDRKVYASLECKDDAIGAGIAAALGTKVAEGGTFYIAIIDVDKLTGIGTDPEKNDVLRTAYLKEPSRDYRDSVMVKGRMFPHRYGCSGIDGITIAPKIGSGKGSWLYAAYGVYSDLERDDNDSQVLLRYSLEELNKTSRQMEFGSFHTSGPAKAEDTYFIFTGNTNWGVQNLAYDKSTGKMFMAVYKGTKPQFKNYDLFAFDIKQKAPKNHMTSGISGWYFKWGSTGLCPIGDGLWYISESGADSSKKQYCKARLYRWTGAETPFQKVTCSR